MTVSEGKNETGNGSTERILTVSRLMHPFFPVSCTQNKPFSFTSMLSFSVLSCQRYFVYPAPASRIIVDPKHNTVSPGKLIFGISLPTDMIKESFTSLQPLFSTSIRYSPGFSKRRDLPDWLLSTTLTDCPLMVHLTASEQSGSRCNLYKTVSPGRQTTAGPSNFSKSQPLMKTGQNNRDSKGISLRFKSCSDTCIVNPISVFQDSGRVTA